MVRDAFPFWAPNYFILALADGKFPDGSRARPLETVQPLANDLGLSVDTSCDRDDQDCVADTVNDYDGPGNILICWEHDALHDIVKELGDDDAPDYPDDRFVLRCDTLEMYKLIVFPGSI